MGIYSGFSHEKWWFSIAMLVYQRVDDLMRKFLIGTFLPYRHTSCCQKREAGKELAMASGQLKVKVQTQTGIVRG